jgi:hypothetical protein
MGEKAEGVPRECPQASSRELRRSSANVHPEPVKMQCIMFCYDTRIPERIGGGSCPGAVLLLGRHTASTKMNKMNLKYELVNARRREA